MTSIANEIFRAYDIRGIVATSLNEKAVFSIGQALGAQLHKLGQEWIVIGRDGRLSGQKLFKALSDGIRTQGINVLDIGQVPTPVVYFATHFLNIPAGVVITGSHNPPEYNGLKIVMNHAALWGESIQGLYHQIQTETFSSHDKLGQIKQQDLSDDYCQYITENLTLERPLTVVVDSGNGVTGNIAPRLYEQLGCKVIPLFCEIDGHFPNHHPDPGQPKNLVDLQKKVLEVKADLGLAFDGDGDRLGVVDSAGNIIWPDRLLILFARDILTRHPGATILHDVKCSMHVASEIEKANGNSVMYKTGHSLIKAKMKELGALLGGEMSGHLFFKERWFGFDDALYAGARLLELFAKETTGVSTKEWFDSLPNSQNTPELLIEVSEQEKFSLVERLIKLAHFEREGLRNPLSSERGEQAILKSNDLCREESLDSQSRVLQDAKISTIDGLRVDFPDGFGLVRASNTSAYLVCRFEGDSLSSLQRIQKLFHHLLLKIIPNAKLPF